jgi:nickel-dependent lactate racemase
MDHTYTLPYGKSSLDLKIDRKTLPTIILPNELKPSEEGICLVKSAIRNPLDGNSISEFVTKKTKVAITINDKTRPVPNNILFPPLLGELERIGIGKENITILIATGTHPPMVEDEFPLLLNPKILTEYAVISHNSDDLTNLVYKGKTDFGTEVYVNKIFDKADIKIVVGDIEPHHFAGFSGDH